MTYPIPPEIVHLDFPSTVDDVYDQEAEDDLWASALRVTPLDVALTLAAPLVFLAAVAVIVAAGLGVAYLAVCVCVAAGPAGFGVLGAGVALVAWRSRR